jgi:uncharacterized repeat protein (TIGR03809 family)
MTHQLDVARGRDVVARWCDLAEQRLEYLTELFETGRWRRFHSELALLENIQEAKTAVETWRDLSLREASRDNSAVDFSWLVRSTARQPNYETPRDLVDRRPPQPAEIVSKPVESDVSIAAASVHVDSDDAPSALASEPAAMEVSVDEVSELTMDHLAAALAERYPQLRNTL